MMNEHLASGVTTWNSTITRKASLWRRSAPSSAIVKVLTTFALIGAFASNVQAQSIWDWSYSGTGVAASGTFTTAGNALTAESILSFNGVRNGDAITGLVPLNSNPGFNYDNLFQTGVPKVNSNGILFNVTAGGVGDVNIYYQDGAYHEYTYSGIPGGVLDRTVNFQVTAAVPEPETYAMLLAGLGLVGAIARRRKTTQA